MKPRVARSARSRHQRQAATAPDARTGFLTG
jgi:hypothetical protein